MSTTLKLASHGWGMGTPRILLIHGLGDGRFVWRDVEALLGTHFGGLSIDLRGHGDSPRDFLQRYDADSLANDVRDLIASLDWPEVVLVGHSLGGEVALRISAAQPQQLRGVVVVDSGPELDREAAERMKADMVSQPTRFSTLAELHAVVSNRHPLASPDLLAHYATHASRVGVDGGFELKFDAAFLGGSDHAGAEEIWALLRSVRSPLLLVRGRLSSMLSLQAALDVQRRVPNCRTAQIDAAGHGVPLENPRGLYEALQPFLVDVLRAR